MGNNESFGVGLVMGAIMGLIGSVLIMVVPLSDELSKHNKLINDCEANQPRSIHCILSATVEEKK